MIPPLPPLHVVLDVTEIKPGGPYELKVSGDRRLRAVLRTLPDVLFRAHRVLDELDESYDIEEKSRGAT